MTSPTKVSLESELACLAANMQDCSLRTLFSADDRRFDKLSMRCDGILFDYSKQKLTQDILKRLHQYAVAADIVGWRTKMAAGELINHTERRAVRHMDLRAGKDAPLEVQSVLTRMHRISDSVRDGSWHGYKGDAIQDVVSIGIGGSDLGPRMVVRALSALSASGNVPRVHFVSNIDGADLAACLSQLEPTTTLFLVVSKTFTTQETMQNAHSARAWLLQAMQGEQAAIARHFVAVSTNHRATSDFGIATENVLEFWDWVGGRYSLWSAVGLPIAIACGFDNFKRLLAGARNMDQHFINSDSELNLPIVMALIDFWNSRFLGIDTHAILPYSQSLALFPAYLQQLEMESNGKRIGRDGEVLAHPACQVVWGEPGTNSQHSFFQLLHQGGRLVACDFIAPGQPDWRLAGHHHLLLANCLAQSAALAFGQNEDEARAVGVEEALLPYNIFPGNQPSSTSLLSDLSPESLGQLIALYEHKIFCLGVLWGLNSFDQWGVELGKRIANDLSDYLLAETDKPVAADKRLDGSTLGLLRAMRKLYPPGRE